MSKTSSGTKTAGKIFAVLTAVLLAAVFAASWYIGGQDKTIEKLCSAAASGDYKTFVKYCGFDSDAFSSEEAFENAIEPYLEGLSEGAADVIGSDVKIDYHKYDRAADKWLCSAEIRFFCSGKCRTYNSIFELSFIDGKWSVTAVNSD